MADKVPDTCLNCGARYDLSEGSFPFAIIPDTAPDQLRAFFMKKLDEYRCRACDQPTGLRPTVIIDSSEKRARHYFLGDHLIAASDQIRKIFVDGLTGDGARAEAYATLEELRATYAKLIVSMVEHILQGLQAVSGDFEGFCTHEWQAFPSNQFAATLVGLSAHLPGVSVDLPLGVEEALNRIATLQTGVWISLCNAWSTGLRDGYTFEADLGHYMSLDANFQSAVDKFLSFTETPGPLPLVPKFCLEAMRASLYLWGEKPNPRLREWAEVFVELEVQRRLLAERVPPYFAALEIGASRARDTIPYEDLFDSCLSQLRKRGMIARPHLGEIGQKLGYNDLSDQLLFAVHFFPNEGSTPTLENLLQLIRDNWKNGPPEALLIIASKCLDLMGKDCSDTALSRFADGIEEILGHDSESRTRVEVWLCRELLKKRLPKLALERVGDKAQPWEEELPAALQVHLWTERSNALRMSGRGKEALEVAESVITVLNALNQPIPAELQRNLGILYREAGQHGEALDIFLRLLPDARRDLELLESVVVTYVSLGRPSEAIPHIETMSELAIGPYADRRPGIIASLAAVKAAIGKRREATALLREIALEEPDDVRVLVPCASAWVALSTYGEQLGREDLEKISALVAKLKNLLEIASMSADVLTHYQIAILLAWLVDVLHAEHPNVYWELVDKNAREFEGAPDPVALLALARNALTGGKLEEMRDYLLEIPSAVSRRYGRERDISLKVQSLSHLRPLFEQLADVAVRLGSFEDLRVIAEVGRDMLGRIAVASISPGVLTGGFVAPNTEEIGLLGGPTAVFEWVTGRDGLYGLATFISSDGTVTDWYQSHMRFEIGLDVLAEKVTQRLSVWHADRTGSPLDLKDWKSFENWLVNELEDRLPKGGRLVIIEHEAVAGLQWHLAAAPRWCVSYVPSWSELLNARQIAVPIKKGPLGVVLVPKYHESAGNLRALDSSMSRTADLGSQLGLEVKSFLNEACDRDALIGALENTAVAKVLCHGFVDPDDDLVALMVAHLGELPLGNSVAANTSAGRRHRVDWRDLQQLKGAPAVLFSAACSSGQSHIVGLGENLGIFSTLRRAGTRSFVAPRWDINPEVILPILDNAMERYLRSDVELGEALHSACTDASEVLPHWEAWALALEGDWK